MIIAATGHRPDKLGGYQNRVYHGLTQLALSYLAEQQDIEYVVSGMALGWDQAFAWAADLLGIPFIAAVPFEGQESRWPAHSKAWYKELLGFAKEIVIVSPGAYTAEKMQIRNEWMVDRADRVCALWNGTPGGTRNCINYALLNEKPVDQMWRQWESLRPT